MTTTALPTVDAHPTRDLPTAERLRVNEIFYSLQGESTRAGLPCVLIRLLIHLAEGAERLHPAQEVVVSIQALCRLSLRALDLGLLQPRLDGPNDARGDLILKVKNVVQRGRTE